MMEQPILFEIMRISRLYCVPSFIVESWPSSELAKQQAFDLVCSEEWRNKYEAMQDAKLSPSEVFKKIKASKGAKNG